MSYWWWGGGGQFLAKTVPCNDQSALLCCMHSAQWSGVQWFLVHTAQWSNVHLCVMHTAETYIYQWCAVYSELWSKV